MYIKIICYFILNFLIGLEKESFYQLCDMCGQYFQHPVTYHMRTSHPGCRGPAGGKGYNSGGNYCGGWAGNCGDGGVGGSSWYLICEKCREEYLKSASQSKHNEDDAESEKKSLLSLSTSPVKPPSSSSRTFSPSSAAQYPQSSHIIMHNNAMFLLDLASSLPNSNTTTLQGKEVRTGGEASKKKLDSVSENDSDNPFPSVPFHCLKLDESKGQDQDISPPEQFQNLIELSQSNNSDPAKKPFLRSVSVGEKSKGKLIL